MKNTILGYSQEQAIKLGLDFVDLSILRWLQDFYPKMSKKIIEGKEFAWIKYAYFIQDMPILGLNSKSAFASRLRKLESVGLIDKKCLKNEDGTFSMVRVTEMIGVVIEITGGCDENVNGGCDENVNQNNQSTNINKSTNISFNEKTKTDPFINSIKDIYIKKYSEIMGKKPYLTFNECNKLIELSECIDNFVETIPIAIERLKKLDFKNINYIPSSSWLLQENNYTKILNGEFGEETDHLEMARKKLMENLKNNGGV